MPIHGMPMAWIDTARLTAAELEDATSNTAKPVDILDDGAGLPGGQVTVRVRGQRDSGYAYLLFEWQDATDGLFRGERLDVPAVAIWKDGWWRLEVKRRFDAHSGRRRPVRAELRTGTGECV